jgi:hypothetical protein
MDGSGTLFSGAAARRYTPGEGGYILQEHDVAGLTSKMLYLFGNLYEQTGYLGHVDIGLAVTGLEGAVTNYWLDELWQHVGRPQYDRGEYRRLLRVLAPTRFTDHLEVARRLVIPLTDVVTEGRLDPFDSKRPPRRMGREF